MLDCDSVALVESLIVRAIVTGAAAACASETEYAMVSPGATVKDAGTIRSDDPAGNLYLSICGTQAVGGSGDSDRTALDAGDLRNR